MSPADHARAVDRLARSLRTGGWTVHARRLAAYLGEHGCPCTRRVGSLELSFHVDSNGYRAELDNEVVATETRVVLNLPDVRHRQALERLDEGALTVRLGVHRARLDRAARARGISSGAFARAAILSYLDARGDR